LTGLSLLGISQNLSKHEELFMGQTRIPVDVTFEHYIAVKSVLEHFLEQIEGIVGNAPKWVSCRLNQTNSADPKPFFLGWVENDALRKIRTNENKPDPGLFRFLDDVDAPVYRNCLKNAGDVWRESLPKLTAGKRINPKIEPLFLYLDCGYFGLPKDQETCRLSIAIKVNGRCVGTLNTGLSKDPGTSINNKMKEWGQSSTSELVQYVNNEFALGGPTV
jgi:hypothetical protein